MGQQGVMEGGEKGGLEAVHRFPYIVWDVVGAWGGGIREFGKGLGYLFRGKGGLILVALEAEEWWRWGLVREKMVKERLCYLSWVRGPWQVQEPWRPTAKREPFGGPEGLWGGRRPEV